MNSRKSVKNQKIDLAVATADSMDLTAIFALFLTEVGRRFVEEIGHFFMFPIAAMASGIRAVLAWRQWHIDGKKEGALVRAVVETVSAAAVTVAVVGGLVAASIFATLSPIIFTVALAAKTLFHLGASVYYAFEYFRSNDKDEKQKYAAMAKGNAVGAFALALATVAVGFVMLAAKPIVGILGVLGGLIGTVYGLYKLYKTPTPAATVSAKVSVEQDDQLEPLIGADDKLTSKKKLSSGLMSTQQITGQLGLEPAVSATISVEPKEEVVVGSLANDRELFAYKTLRVDRAEIQVPFTLPSTPAL